MRGFVTESSDDDDYESPYYSDDYSDEDKGPPIPGRFNFTKYAIHTKLFK